MVQKLNRLIGRADFRVMVFVAILTVLVTIGWTFAQLADDSNTVDTLQDVAELFLELRENSYRLAVPSWYMHGDEMEAMEEAYGLAGFALQPDWFVAFSGELFFSQKSEIAQKIKHGEKLIIYEDMLSGELLIVREDTGEEEIVFKAPEWPEISKNEPYKNYLFRELSKRRVVWHITLKEIDQAEAEYTAMLAAMEEESGFGGGMMMLLMGGGDELAIAEMNTVTNGLLLNLEYTVSFSGTVWSAYSYDAPACADSDTNCVPDPAARFDGLVPPWTLVYSNIVLTGVTFTAWTDTRPMAQDASTNPVHRFYAFGNNGVDTDADGLNDAFEIFIVKTDPELEDTDNDGIPDGWEWNHGFDPLNASDSTEDPDIDGLSNLNEYLNGTDPYNSDTDGDGFIDGYEVDSDSDPLDVADAPVLFMLINGGEEYTSDTNLTLRFPGYIATNATIGEASNLSDGVSVACNPSAYYSLQHATNGSRVVYAQLYGPSGVSAIISGNILLDTVPPSLGSFSPTNGYVTNRRWIKITGVATDALSQVQVFVDDEWAHGNVQTQFWHDRILLQQGSNPLTIVARDLAGNATTQTVDIIQDSTGDITAPNLSVSLPGQSTNGAPVVYGDNPALYFQGTTDDETAEVSAYTVADSITNGPWAAVVSGTQVWGNVQLQAGSNLLVVTALDAADNVTTLSRTVVRDTNFIFEITSPAGYQVMNSASAVVSGVASPMFLNATITVNGVATTITDHGSNVTFATVSGVPLSEDRTELVGVAEFGADTYYTDPTLIGYEILSVANRWKSTLWSEYWVPCGHGLYKDSVDIIQEWSSTTKSLHFMLVYNEHIDCYYNLCIPDTFCDSADNVETYDNNDSQNHWIEFGYSELSGDDYWGPGDTIRETWRDNHSVLRFVKRWPTQELQHVVLQFPGMRFRTDTVGWLRFPLEVDDPSLITYRGQTGFWYNGNVSFVVPIKTEVEYSIRASDFTWPSYHVSDDGLDIRGHNMGFYSAISNNILSVDITKAWSDQYSGTVQNYLPGSSGSAGYGYMMMGARSDNKCYAKAEVAITPDTPEIRSKLLFNWAGIDGGTYVLDAVNNATLSGNVITLSAGEKRAEDHAFVAGVDQNGDGQLQASEVCAVSPARFKPVSQFEYTTERAYLQILYWLPGLIYPTAYSFLDSFLNDTVPAGASTVSTTINVNEPTHNVGAVFLSAGYGSIQRHEFAPSSDLAALIYASEEFHNALAIETFGPRRTEVQNYFAAHTNETEHVFTWSLPAQIMFGASFDLHSSLGTATLGGTVAVTVRQVDLEVTQIHVQGNVSDLYDWDYNLGSPDSRAARVQAGYNTLGNGGHIYRVRVDLDKVDTAFSYNFR